ncbi:MAG: hypothetical protein K8S24_04120 [Candidatus Aegiribacteria sp.]|nr:hypothetical protein [Candidatus Aegiribacteria sp.]
MKYIAIILAFAVTSAFGIECLPLENTPSGGQGTDDLLQYDDGTPFWIISGYSLYITWFDIEDFYPGALNFECDHTEWWFYHDASTPWDTDKIQTELWTWVDMPVTMLNTTTITALHFSPVLVNYPTPISTTANFCMIANTTVYSAEGVPSVIFDESGNFTGEPHSFFGRSRTQMYSAQSGRDDIDAFFRAEGNPMNALENNSWGAIKYLFR